MATDYTIGDTIYIKFTTRAFDTGVPTVLSGTPVLSVYEDASTTQITAGVSLTVDLDSVVGLNLATIVATTGNGFESSKQYAIVVTAGTVGGVSVVGEVIDNFTIEKSAAFIVLNSSRAEPAQGIPPVNPTILVKMDYLYKSWRNKKNNDGSTTNLFNDDTTTVDHKQTTTSSGGTVTKTEWVSGP